MPGDVLNPGPTTRSKRGIPLEAELSADEAIEEGYVPVRFHPKVTELGMPELWCYSTKTDGRWKLRSSACARRAPSSRSGQQKIVRFPEISDPRGKKGNYNTKLEELSSRNDCQTPLNRQDKETMGYEHTCF